MRDVLETLIFVPMPLLFILLVGLVVWRHRRLSFSLICCATVLLVILSMPITPALLLQPLDTEPRLVGETKPNAILVPTAGIFRDPSDRWWSNNTGIARAVRGSQLSRDYGVPLILSGGTPGGEPVSEAGVVAEQLGLGGPSLILEHGAENTWDTAVAASRIISERGGHRVLVVKSAAHVKRMAASLRAQGLEVFVETAQNTIAAKVRPLGDWFPTSSGLGASRAVLYEYIAILYYLTKGYIDLEDLVAELSGDSA